MIKRNESDVGHIVFEIFGKNSVQILSFHIVFKIDDFFDVHCNQISNFNVVCIKMKHFEVMRKKVT